MTNTIENNPSTVETIKDKAANLISKVTGKSHDTASHEPANPAHAEPHTQHQHHDQAHTHVPGQHTEQGQVNPSAFLSSVRLPEGNANTSAAHREEIARPDAIHDPNHHTGAHVPSHGHHVGTEAAAGAAAAEAVHHHYKHVGDHTGEHVGEHGHSHDHHRVDDLQRDGVSRLVGEVGHPAGTGLPPNVGVTGQKPVM
ncbi:hypothetical protein BGX26_002377 [Mortierella sp. AD094]|nr:hypothetical protein BGX26_002377 [Mortierella sp. AD094]